MTKARIQPFCRAKDNNLGCIDGIRVFQRSVTQGNIALFLHSNHCCLIWKSEDVRFNQATQQLKENFKKVDNYITEKKMLNLILYMNSFEKN